MSEEESTRTEVIRVDSKGIKEVAGGEMHWLRDRDGVFYSAFHTPDGWEEIKEGDTVAVTYEKREKKGRVYRNIQEEGIQPVFEREEREAPKEEARPRKRRRGGLGLSTRDLMVKWTLEAASRELAGREEVSEEEREAAIQQYRLFAQRQLGLPSNIEEEE